MMAALLTLLSMNRPALSEESLEDLKKQIEALQQKVDQLESNQAQNVVPVQSRVPVRSTGVQQWNPFDQFDQMQQQMDSLFQGFFNSPSIDRQGIFSNNIMFD